MDLIFCSNRKIKLTAIAKHTHQIWRRLLLLTEVIKHDFLQARTTSQGQRICALSRLTSIEQSSKRMSGLRAQDRLGCGVHLLTSTAGSCRILKGPQQQLTHGNAQSDSLHPVSLSKVVMAQMSVRHIGLEDERIISPRRRRRICPLDLAH